MSETWDDWYDRTKYARRADLDQAVAAIREKVERLGPELDQEEPEKALKRLALVLRAAVPEYGSDALAVVLADYVMRDRRR